MFKESLGPSIDIAFARKNKDAISLAAEALDWSTCSGGGALIIWVLQKDDIVEGLQKMRSGQWLSHIPGILEACSKASLSTALQNRHACFWPNSWRIPDICINQICEEAFAVGPAAVIIKPDCGSQGQGISLARSHKELQRHVRNLQTPIAIVQEYVDPPLLLRGFKWDMRIYALVMSNQQGGLKCFLAQEGLARVCIDPYERPDNRNLHRLTVHLTNYSLSKFSDKFIFTENPEDGTQGCKRTLSAVLGVLESDTGGKINPSRMWQALGQLTRQTVNAMNDIVQVAVVDPATWEGSGALPPEAMAELAKSKIDNCFQILGLDVLLDQSGRPWLLEVNNNPSLSLDELRPLAAKTRAEVNELFAFAKRNSANGQRWGRPCRCAGHPRPHSHHLGPVDAAVKLPIVEGALKIIQRASESGDHRNNILRSCAWAEGTVFELV